MKRLDTRLEALKVLEEMVDGYPYDIIRNPRSPSKGSCLSVSVVSLKTPRI